MNAALRISRWLIITMLTGYVLFSSFGLLKLASKHSNPNLGNGDFVTDWENRMERVKKKLPKDVTLIGYVADWDLPGEETDSVDQDNEYMLSQYSLAPVKVVPGLDAEWILGNFTNPVFRGWLDQSLTDYKIKELGYGIYLIHRTLP